MDVAGLLGEMGLAGHPAGTGGCRASGRHFEACAHDVMVFDGQAGSEAAKLGGELVMVRHASLSEGRSGVLLGYEGMGIISDESWDLRALLASISERRALLYADHARHCLVESLMCCQRGRIHGGVRGACWQKCASYYLADAICALNSLAPGPSHVLDALRGVGGDAGRHVETVTRTSGAERATPTLLERMSKSAAGMAGMAGIVTDDMGPKAGYFADNSMLTDCYFYLGYVCRAGMAGSSPDEHLLRTAFDAESDPGAVARNLEAIEGSCGELLESGSQPI